MDRNLYIYEMFSLNDGDPKQWYVTIFIIGEKLKGSTFLFA